MQSEETPLIVLDTNVLVAGLCRYENSPSYILLKEIQKGKVPVVLNEKLFLEYESVLNREKILQLTGISQEEVKIVLNALLAIAHKSKIYYLWRPNLIDASDNFILEIAVASGALVVTKNVKDFKSGELKFPEIMIMTPKEFCHDYLAESTRGGES